MLGRTWRRETLGTDSGEVRGRPFRHLQYNPILPGGVLDGSISELRFVVDGRLGGGPGAAEYDAVIISVTENGSAVILRFLIRTR